MPDLKLFSLVDGRAEQNPARAISLEKEVQNLFEQNLETLIGCRFLASEYRTSNGRIDSLALDEDGCPVIVEYKRSQSENVINQGLFYLDWLMDHKADFELLVRDTLGKKMAEAIDWGAPRLVCVAAGFSRYDEYAVKQINRNIELLRFKFFEKNALVVELLTAQSETSSTRTKAVSTGQTYKTVSEALNDSPKDIQQLFEETRSFITALGEDVQEKTLRFYFAFKRIRNFACVEVKSKDAKVVLYLKVDPDLAPLGDSRFRDVRKIGHFGTGDLEITLRSLEDLEIAQKWIEASYAQS